jgi:peroxiredoxin
MAAGAGKEAPDFKVRDIYGEEIELKSFKGKKNILLFFSRYIGCSWCQMFVIDIMLC